MKKRILISVCLAVSLTIIVWQSGKASASDLRFEISYPADVASGPITGRVFVTISKNNRVEPRLQAGSYGGSVPFYGVDVDGLKPAVPAVIDNSTLGFPIDNLSHLRAGEYYIQAVFNVYTQVHRKDGHVIWVHMDQWEGQKWN